MGLTLIPSIPLHTQRALGLFTGIIAKTDYDLLNSHHPKKYVDPFSSFLQPTSWGPGEHKLKSRLLPSWSLPTATHRRAPSLLAGETFSTLGFLRPEQDWIHDSQGPLQNENVEPLFKNLGRISRWRQQGIKALWALLSEAMSHCTGHRHRSTGSSCRGAMANLGLSEDRG